MKTQRCSCSRPTVRFLTDGGGSRATRNTGEAPSPHRIRSQSKGAPLALPCSVPPWCPYQGSRAATRQANTKKKWVSNVLRGLSRRHAILERKKRAQATLDTQGSRHEAFGRGATVRRSVPASLLRAPQPEALQNTGGRRRT